MEEKKARSKGREKLFFRENDIVLRSVNDPRAKASKEQRSKATCTIDWDSHGAHGGLHPQLTVASKK